MARLQPAYKPRSTIMIAAAPGIQRDALVSLLRAQADLAVAAVAGDAAALRRQLAARGATVAVLDAGLHGAPLPELIRTLRREFPGVRCVALANTTAQCAACTAAGAHAVLLKGCLGEHLLAAIEG
jgi:DNA-binding NarL/FixJ family response regulator